MSEVTITPVDLRRVSSYFNPSLFGQKLSVASYSLLQALARRNDQAVTTGALSEELGLSRFDIDWAAELFESQGYISVRRNLIDWDRTTLSASTKGLEAYERLRHEDPAPLEQQVHELVDRFLRKHNVETDDRHTLVDAITREYRARSGPTGSVEPRSASLGQNEKATAIARMIENDSKSRDLQLALRLYAFATWFHDVLSEGSELAEWLGSVRRVFIWLDTNFVVSLMSPLDAWYGVSRSLLKTANEVRRRSGIDFEFVIASGTIDELEGLLAHVVDRMGSISRRDQAADTRSDESGVGLTAEFFSRPEIPSPHAFANELLLRLQTQIRIYRIKRQIESYPFKASRQDEEFVRAKLDDLFPSAHGIQRARARHDLMLLRCARRCLRDDAASWLWTFDSKLPALEHRSYGNNYCAISNLYVASILQSIDYLLGPQREEEFASRIWNFAQRYYGTVLSARRHLDMLVEETDAIVADVAGAHRRISVPNTWAVLAKIGQRHGVEFGVKEARAVLRTQRELLDTVTGAWGEPLAPRKRGRSPARRAPGERAGAR